LGMYFVQLRIAQGTFLNYADGSCLINYSRTTPICTSLSSAAKAGAYTTGYFSVKAGVYTIG